MSTGTTIASSISASNGIKRSAPEDDDEDLDSEFQALLAKRAAKHSRHDYDRYVDILNNPDIKSTLGWWSEATEFRRRCCVPGLPIDAKELGV